MHAQHQNLILPTISKDPIENLNRIQDGENFPCNFDKRVN